MEQRFFICNHCGNMIAFVNDSGNPVVCCGELMHEVIPGVIDASIEKHVPVYSVKDGIVHVDVGSILHPMNEDHHIEWDFPSNKVRKSAQGTVPDRQSRQSALPFAKETKLKQYMLIAICTAFG